MSHPPSTLQEAQFGALTIGNFDGVHLGHRTLLKRLKTEATKVNGPAVVLTFDPPPLRLLRPDLARAPLTTSEFKMELLLEAGADSVIELETTPEFLQVEADAFFEQVVLRDFQAKTIVEGTNFRFGKNRLGDNALLAKLCAENGISFLAVDPELSDGEWISSTRIRELIGNGKLRQANELLAHHHRISGLVSPGAKRGRTLGFPTANLEEIPTLIPGAGVYAARVVSSTKDTENSKNRFVALHIGPNPTFGESAMKVEAHLLDYQGDLYDAQLELEIFAEVRSVQKFASKDELLQRLHLDIETVRNIAAEFPAKA